MNIVRSAKFYTRIACLCALAAAGFATADMLAPHHATAAEAKSRINVPPAEPVAAGAPENDLCENAKPIGEESDQYSTVDADTDGLAVVGVCFDSGFPQVSSDIWYCYTATADGIATAATCSAADYDTKIAIYEGCGCTTGRAVACDDDDCVQALRSTVNFLVTGGAKYLIRVGGFPGVNDQGTGELVVSLIESPCPGSGKCFNPDNGSPGCDDGDCCNNVCLADPFCCESEWDDICVEEANGLCDAGDGFTDCGQPEAGDCFASNGSPGCEESACCQAVCEEDTLCCTNTWDARCANAADTTAECNCGPEQGDCFTAHAEAGCQTPGCCTLVCAFDNSCCTEEWTESCAVIADGLCDGGAGWSVCNPPGDGDCFDADNGSPGCDVEGCCNSVCDNDPFCCVSDWDGFCADSATEVFCGKGDFDFDRDIDLVDFNEFNTCRDNGQDPIVFPCTVFDFDNNNNIDLTDWGKFQSAFTGAVN